jgi:hypothetical protein
VSVPQHCGGGGRDAGCAAFVERHKRELAANRIATAEAAGATDAEALGRLLAVLVEGALALATSLNDSRPLEGARSLAATLIDNAIVREDTDPATPC